MGRPVPAPFNDPPKLPAGAGIFMQAFNELSEERRDSDSVVYGITSRQIRQWAVDMGYVSDLWFMEELVSHIRAMDRVWIDVEVARRKRAAKASNKGRSGGNAKGFRKTPAKSIGQRQENV